MHEGRYCSEKEISLQVQFIPPKDNKGNLEGGEKVFYFDISHTVEQCKYEVCEEFGITDKDEIK